jgi:ADP-ribosylation factor-like protein 3
VYVVDSADDMRIEEATKELNELLEADMLQKIPLLVFANKQDMATAMDAEEVIE